LFGDEIKFKQKIIQNQFLDNKHVSSFWFIPFKLNTYNQKQEIIGSFLFMQQSYEPQQERKSVKVNGSVCSSGNHKSQNDKHPKIKPTSVQPICSVINIFHDADHGDWRKERNDSVRTSETCC